MHLLEISAGLQPSLAYRPLLQHLAALPPPEVPGLRSRWWQAEHRTLKGSYLFRSRPELDSFAAYLDTDPAVQALGAAAPDEQLRVRLTEVLDSEDMLDRPCFIIAAPRAGSTLLYDLLCKAPHLWALPGESRGVIEGIATLHPANRGYRSHRLDERDVIPETAQALRAGFLTGLLDRNGARYLDSAPAAQAARPLRLIEKTPENALRVAFLDAAFADARFVFLHRDARQSISSLIEAWRHGGFVNIPNLPGWDGGEWCFLLPAGWESLNGRPLSDVAAFQWHAANQQALDDLISVDRSRWIVVEYADLVAHPESVIRRVLAFLEIEVDEVLADTLTRRPQLTSTAITPPSPIKWRTNRLLLETSYASMGPMMGRLRNLNTPVASAPPRPPRSILPFSCFLDELSDRPLEEKDLSVTPHYWLQTGATVPLQVLRRTRHRDRFLADHPVAWVEDAGTKVLYPFWAQRHQLVVLRELCPGSRLPPSISPPVLARLRRAGILTSQAQLQEQRRSREDQVIAARSLLKERRWCKLTGLIRPSHVTALGSYYRAMIDSGQWALGDDQVARRHGWYNERMARFFQFQLVDLIGRIADEAVKATYSYSSAYQGGARLGAHMDRKQCEYTLSLLIDQSDDDHPWPLWFETAAGPTPVTMEPGDAVLFRGCELPHWREASAQDRHQTMLLFHYVPATFVGVLS